MQLDNVTIREFQDRIFLWYQDNERDLPWREMPDDISLGDRAYRILVSEVMSQQTQLGRVIPKYEAWITRFPTVAQLADGSLREVLEYWSGLGYNSRALNLQKTARIIVRELEGVFPQHIHALMELPGIGKYTAAAVACFAFDQQIPVVDTNIRKVITHEFFNGELPDEKTIEEVALQILPIGKAYKWNQALMDYSSLVLKQAKIPVPKQSHFLSSDRYFRGQTVKLLIGKQEMSIAELWDYFDRRNPILLERLITILDSMQKDGLIQHKKKCLSLAKT